MGAFFQGFPLFLWACEVFPAGSGAASSKHTRSCRLTDPPERGPEAGAWQHLREAARLLSPSESALPRRSQRLRSRPRALRTFRATHCDPGSAHCRWPGRVGSLLRSLSPGMLGHTPRGGDLWTPGIPKGGRAGGEHRRTDSAHRSLGAWPADLPAAPWGGPGRVWAQRERGPPAVPLPQGLPAGGGEPGAPPCQSAPPVGEEGLRRGGPLEAQHRRHRCCRYWRPWLRAGGARASAPQPACAPVRRPRQSPASRRCRRGIGGAASHLPGRCASCRGDPWNRHDCARTAARGHCARPKGRGPSGTRGWTARLFGS